MFVGLIGTVLSAGTSICSLLSPYFLRFRVIKITRIRKDISMNFTNNFRYGSSGFSFLHFDRQGRNIPRKRRK